MIIIAYVCVSMVLLLLCGVTESSDFSQHGLFWGSNAGSSATISQENVWQNIDGASMDVNLMGGESKDVLITYHVIVEGVKRNLLNSPLPSENNKDVLQIRALVDGVPFRMSSSYASTYLVEQRVFSELTASFVAGGMTAGAGATNSNHTVLLQWKKIGTNVDRWIVSPPSMGNGYSLSALADHSKVWYAHETNDLVLQQKGVWLDASKKLEFYLEQDTNIVIGYAMNVNPQVSKFVKDRKQEYVSSRIVIDGVAFTEGSETHGTGSWNPSAGCLNGYMSIKLTAGVHEVQLQWRRMGDSFRSWSSSPSYLDGFASARNIFVLQEKYVK